MIQLALFEPDIAGNVGTILRLAAGLSRPIHIIEPCGFPFSARALRRAGMDYIETANITRHDDYAAFHAWRQAAQHRLILLTTKGAESYHDAVYRTGDILMAGRESAGVPDHVHGDADMRVVIPMAPGTRSLNVAVSIAMVTGEAMRQTALSP